MGKKRIATTKGNLVNSSAKSRALSRLPKKKISAGTLHVRSTYNNTRASLTDKSGNMLATSSSGALGFRGAKKGTPFAAAKVGEIVGDSAKALGVKEVDVIVKGVGAGRESAIRSFASNGVGISGIQDQTPIPHNGTRPPKPRRV
jgi:small subunit ribosomal protein S11